MLGLLGNVKMTQKERSDAEAEMNKYISVATQNYKAIVQFLEGGHTDWVDDFVQQLEEARLKVMAVGERRPTNEFP
eukprot:gnl/Chilomastix_caulleri/8645.p1 GENE.gnl/Chilomastix_caulleri/8645~~gnl/Chilomastix_caulleri/8645.p1  ORF type:complete len:76 (+),score=22.83 gnl/Chilomastix_caulleri/8645:29-256(+)